jgi:hypothetical protein
MPRHHPPCRLLKARLNPQPNHVVILKQKKVIILTGNHVVLMNKKKVVILNEVKDPCISRCLFSCCRCLF